MLTEGKSYQIDLKSKDFDAVLRLEDPTGKEIAFNDDAGPDTLDSRIIQTINKTGEYKIIATCLDGKAGKFTLTVVEAQAGAATASMFKAGKAIELTLKDGKASYTGELTKDDAVVRLHHFKVFTIKLEGGKTYRIEHRDAGDDAKFDPFLFLEDAQGKVLANDDDSAGGLNARIVYKAASAGVYRIVATTQPANQTGKFTLEVMPGTPEDEKLANLMERIRNFAKSPVAEQKKTVAEVTKLFQAKGAGLAVGDAQLAMELGNSLEQGDPDVAKSAYKSLAKSFSAASNPQIASVAKHFEGTLKRLEMIGKELLISGKTVEGKDFDLKSFKGKVVLVDFWATWCGPCIAEMPNIERAFDKYPLGKGFEVIGVSLDQSDAAITKFAEARKMKWTSINIEDSKVLADRYFVNSIPFPVLVDQAGNVVSINARGPQLDMLLEHCSAGKANKARSRSVCQASPSLAWRLRASRCAKPPSEVRRRLT